MATVVVDTREQESPEGTPAGTLEASQILAVDGKQASECEGTMVQLAPGCHLVSVSFRVALYGKNASKALVTQSGTMQPTSRDVAAPDYRITRVLFAVPMAADRTYKVNARLADTLQARMDELDAAGKSLREYYPVNPATVACDASGPGSPPPAASTAPPTSSAIKPQ